MKLIAFMNSTRNDEFRKAVGDDFIANGGYANGYVAVPPEHPYHGKDYDKPLVDVHGGLTFDASAKEVNERWKSLEFIGDETELPDDYWVFGFDTLHCNDNITNWPRERCVEETIKLKEQLEKMSNNIVFK
ncbi:hypothetical protein [Xylanibacter muris]|uniref:hypothetical protein n=1 Tax=Xylanibacter muris TaxID=2736290 RepID=UPI0025A0068A|nr:hypothetical protein [Xylanibacter muris]